MIPEELAGLDLFTVSLLASSLEMAGILPAADRLSTAREGPFP